MARRTRKQRNARIRARRKGADLKGSRTALETRKGKRAGKGSKTPPGNPHAMGTVQRAGMGSTLASVDDWREVRSEQDDRTTGHDIRPETPASLAPPVEGPIVWDYSRTVGAIGH